MPRAIWSGAISFGLVNVPVKAYTAVRDHKVHFHRLEKGTGARVRNKQVSEKTGSLVPETPTTLILYREDCAFLLDQIIPRQDAPRADFDLVLASQPFRLRASTEFKAKRVLAPLAPRSPRWHAPCRDSS